MGGARFEGEGLPNLLCEAFERCKIDIRDGRTLDTGD